MHLNQIKIRQFKNFADQDFSFSSKLNAFVGANGIGKTNVLDAIHYLALTKSYLNASDVQNIQHGKEGFYLEGDFELNDSTENIVCVVKTGSPKQIKKNGKLYERISDHIGQLPVVMVSPYDIDLIKEGSEARRKFMDNIISQSNKIYLADLMRYNKVLVQRNALLKYFAANHTFDALQLQIYDEELHPLGQKIYEVRKAFILEFLPEFQNYYHKISQGNESVQIDYESQLNDKDFAVLLQENLSKDRLAQYSTTGIHKDDLGFKIKAYPVKKFGSQGQQKSFLIALKLAQFAFIKKNSGIQPLLLLDDIFDKLDEKRVTQLIALVNEDHFGQIFITDTHEERTKQVLELINSESKIIALERNGEEI